MKYYFIFLSLLFIHSSEAQYFGGSGDGYHSAINLSAVIIYAGGAKDGYNQATISSMTSIYAGGVKDGYAQKELLSNTSIYTGGAKDGYTQKELSSTASIYTGGAKDGYHTTHFNNSISIYSGGNQDGYALADTIANLIWTGAVGTGWNVDGNWNLGFYPRLRHGAIIPAGLTNYPKVNAGLLTVGKDLNGGIYFCRGIHLAAGAEMTLRVNTLLENYGLINIFGNLIILSTMPEAVKIIYPGKMSILNGAQMTW